MSAASASGIAFDITFVMQARMKEQASKDWQRLFYVIFLECTIYSEAIASR